MTEHCNESQRECPWNREMIVEHGKLLEGLETLKRDIGVGFTGVNARLDKQNGRIGKLENWRWYLMGAFGAVLVILKILKVQI
jgi:hypothetical protein